MDLDMDKIQFDVGDCWDVDFLNPEIHGFIGGWLSASSSGSNSNCVFTYL